ncbi:putative sporulation protein YtaF [Desulfitobacterium sp. LBE]|nr:MULTISPECIES: sporulation membrane protein YtaF [Desulfitobacterium]ACL20499.1 sporulation protein YtaF [Desulfitobacterium hafniense DCB-2]KTE92384.1 sporulation protein [Desulfitobacterium hafniense]MEA5025997.1 sporulation membrane protein YtaF [Desulfitobacterium hafniense]TWH56679.1 putative sporulation protein YtaF [Desulfitobacterium sp. LBE]CDX01352.1 Sporulation protein YtaF [Desulfitobacterium hafniense]
MGAAILFAIALSFDGFGVGVSYGIRRIRIPLLSMLIITLCTVVAMGTALFFGDVLIGVITVVSPNLIAAGILLTLGGYQLIKAIPHLFKKETPKAEPASTIAVREPVLKLEFKILGVVVQVLKTPEQADLDGSGVISAKESVLLGTALSLDAFASGLVLGLAVGIFNSLSVIAWVALMQIFMIKCGQALAGRLPEEYLGKLGLLPGTMLILIALGKLI